MPFPAAGGTTFPYTLDVAWASARSTAANVKQQSQTLFSQITSGPTSAQVLLNSLAFFVTLNSQLTAYASVPGIAAYAQAQVNNPTLDVAGSFTTMQNALVAVGTWIQTNFPVDAQGFLQAQQFVGGVPTYVTFTTTQLQGLATALTTLINTIS